MGELVLPGDIPIAVQSTEKLSCFGNVVQLGSYSKSSAAIIDTGDAGDPFQLWVSPFLRNYRAAWNQAVSGQFLDSLEAWGDNVDVDHLYPKSWAKSPAHLMSHVRVFPVWAEVNRSAGAGREKAQLRNLRPRIAAGIVYAEELQVLKLLGHPVGGTSDPVTIFRQRRRR